MDSRRKLYVPGAGTARPKLAGRGEFIERASMARDRIGDSRSARRLILYGFGAWARRCF
jgi:hypothetical protein